MRVCIYIYIYAGACTYAQTGVCTCRYADIPRWAQVCGFFPSFFFLFPLLPLFYEKKYRQESPFRYSGKDLIVVGH